MSLPSCRHRQVAAGHACGQVKSIHVDETEVFVQTANQTVHKGQCPRHHLNAFKFQLLHWMFAALLHGRCGQWCSFALGRRGTAIIVTASLALLQAQRIEFHPRMAQSWLAPWPKSFRQFSRSKCSVGFERFNAWKPSLLVLLQPKETLDRGLSVSANQLTVDPARILPQKWNEK